MYKTALELGVTPLPDNRGEDKYFYELVVRTGMWRDAATDSRVQFVLCGDEATTRPREMGDRRRPCFRRGQTNHFVMATPKPLGDLHFIRIWHDNSGSGKFASWFLSQVIVVDLQTKKRFQFVTNKWLALEKDDSMIERMVAVSSPKEATSFGHLFSGKSRKDLSDDHIWFSLFSRPPRSRFTRVQRLACCVCILLTSMLASAMWYNTVPDTPSQYAFRAGPFVISPESIGVAIMANLIVFPVNFIIMQLFRKSRRQHQQAVVVQQALKQKSDQNSGAVWPLPPQQVVVTDDGNISETKKSSSCLLPWWCRLVAWALWLAVAGTCLAFVLFYGIMFGEEKTRKWLSSILMGFVTSVVLTQPIKIVFLAVFCSCLCRKELEEDDEEDIDAFYLLDHDHDYLHLVASDPPQVSPKEAEHLDDLRLRRWKETKSIDIVKEVVVYMVFALVVIVMSYGNRDPAAYDYNRTLRTHLLGTGKPVDYHIGGTHIALAAEPQFRNVTTREELWAFLQWTLVPRVRAARWYQGDAPIFQRGVMGDRVSRVLGHPILRQVRVEEGTCELAEKGAQKSSGGACVGSSGLRNEESGDFGTGWTALAAGSAAPTEYVYRSSGELGTFPRPGDVGLYGGGGYVWHMAGSVDDIQSGLARLHLEGWIDRQTRLVQVELGAFNAFANFFVAGKLTFELPSTGGIVAKARFDPVRLLRYQTNFGTTLLACEIVFCIYIIVFIVKEVRELYKVGGGAYVRNLWNWIEIFVILFAAVVMGLYIKLRLIEVEVMDEFETNNGNLYISLDGAVLYDQYFVLFLALVLFLTTIKFTRLLRFNARIQVLLSTLRSIKEKLLGFVVVTTVIFVAYSNAFYFILHKNLWVFSTYLRTAEVSFAMMLGKFEFQSIVDTSTLAGPFFFCFSLTIVILMLNVMATILNDMFTEIREDAMKRGCEHEVLEYIMGRMTKLISKERQKSKDMYTYVHGKAHGQFDEANQKMKTLFERSAQYACGSNCSDGKPPVSKERHIKGT